MAKSDLTAEELRKILRYDADTGAFYWLKQLSNRCDMNSPAGQNRAKDGRRIIGIRNKIYYASRLAWLYVTGEWPKEHLDHINIDPSDDRFCNLRECTLAENNQNIGPRARNKSGITGVSWSKKHGKWRAQISSEGRTMHLGLFGDIEDARDAYAKAKRERHLFQPFVRIGASPHDTCAYLRERDRPQTAPSAG